MERLLAACLMLLAFTSPVQAEDIGPVTVSKSAEGDELDVTPSSLDPNSLKAARTIDVRCDGVSCEKLTATIYEGDARAAQLRATEESSTTASFRVDPERHLSERTHLVFATEDAEGNPLKSPRLLLVKAASNDEEEEGDDPFAGGGKVKPSAWRRLLGVRCPAPLVDHYNRSANRAEIVVTPTGMVRSKMPANFDENDHLVVHVVAHEDLLPHLRVTRSSAFRPVGGINILGADANIVGLIREAAKDPKCATAEFTLRDFAPGKGEVTIVANFGGAETTLGTVEFAVNPLYHGMFAFGGVWSRVQDPEFGLASSGDQQVITRGEKGDRRFLYTLFYTPFVWGPRDVEKGYQEFYHRVNPTVGFAVEDPLENAFLGASIEARGFAFTLGAHVSHVSVLDNTSGLSEGDPFTGEPDEVPTAEDWDAGFYWGVTVDVRAAVKLVGAVLRGATN